MVTNTTVTELSDREVRTIRALSVPPRKRRVPTDAEVADILPQLQQLVGAEEAAKPSWIRRIVVHCETGAPLLLVRGPKVAISSIFWPLALPLESGCALLASTANPEIALQAQMERRRR